MVVVVSLKWNETMIKTLLIPTDFTAGGLLEVRAFLDRNQHEKYRVVFIHRISLSTSMQEMLFFNWKNFRSQIVPESFYAQLLKLTVDYNEIVEYCDIAFFYGWRQGSFNSFVKRFENPLIFVSEYFPFQFNAKHSLDIMPMVKKVQAQKVVLRPTNFSFDYLPKN